MGRKTEKLTALLHFARQQQAHPAEITALLHFAQPDQLCPGMQERV
jgi:hypothetical protein